MFKAFSMRSSSSIDPRGCQELPAKRPNLRLACQGGTIPAPKVNRRSLSHVLSIFQTASEASDMKLQF